MKRTKLKKIKPVILIYYCSDHDPIELWQPEDPADVDVWVLFSIGPDRSGGNDFYLHIVTPNNLRGANPGRHGLIINWYDWPTVLQEVDKILDACQGYDWGDIVEKLAKHMKWEYENFIMSRQGQAR
jgi:hypothetical protein